MPVNALQRAIRRRGVDRLIIVAMQLVAGRNMKEVNSQQRSVFNQRALKPFGIDGDDETRLLQPLEAIVPTLFVTLCQLAVRREFLLITREQLAQRVNFVGEKWLMSKLKEILEEFIAESISEPRSISFFTGCFNCSSRYIK